MGGTRAFPCMTLGVPRSGPQGSPLPIPGTEPHASSSGCRLGGFAGTHPPVLSTCSNSGKFWTWRSFSMSGAPRWVMPKANPVQRVPGRVSGEPGGSAMLSPALPSSPVPGTTARSAPRGSPGTTWGGHAGPCRRHWREERARSVPPRAARVPLCLDVSVVSSPLSVPLSQTLLPARGRFWGLSRDPRPLRGPQSGLFISALWQPHLLRQLS